MDENGTYSWPGGQNTRPKKKPDFKRAGRTVIAVIAALLVLAVALTCFYTVDDKQQAVVTTFGKVTLAICGAVMLFTFLRMQKYCKPVEYRR